MPTVPWPAVVSSRTTAWPLATPSVARQITVTANAQSRAYGDANPDFTYVVGGNGLVNGDQLGGALATTADQRSSKGTYGITQGTLTTANNPNYAITFKENTLVIDPRQITVTANHQSRFAGFANARGEALQVLRLGGGEADAPDEPPDLLFLQGGQGRGRRRPGKQGGGDLVDHLVRGLGREQHRHQQGEGIFVRQGDVDFREEAVEDLADAQRFFVTGHQEGISTISRGGRSRPDGTGRAVLVVGAIPGRRVSP